MNKFDPNDFLVFEGLSGSRLYGTATPESDTDYRGVCLPPMDVLLHPFNSFEVADSFEGADRAVYSLKKFMALCADNNPNVLELLWTPPQMTVVTTPVWKKLVENRHLFLSKNVKYRFTGYAFSQLKALERHRQWFLDPPDHKPTREEFGLTQTPLVSEGALENVMSVSAHLFKEEHSAELQRERAYRLAKKKWDEYRQWQESRNPARKHSEEKYGYDGKYASHLFRLMEEGRQLLLFGEVEFPLHNAQWLLDVKNGMYTYDEIVNMSREWESKFEVWAFRTTLPERPNRNALAKLYFELVKDYAKWM